MLKRILLTLILILTLCSIAGAGQDIKFQWDPYTTDPIVGFKLYMAGAPGVSPTTANLVAAISGQATIAYTQVNAPAGVHYWVLTAYTATMESDPSNEVTYTIKLKPPGHLTNTVILTFGSVLVTVTRK